MKTILVTGAGGYIGTTLVPELLKRGYYVKAVDRFFFGMELLESSDNLELIKKDTRCLKKEILQDVDYVIDLVAVSNDPSGELFQKATWEINHESRVRMATMAKESGVKRYILPSSCSIYGFQESDVICSEDYAINPLTTYSKANRAAERDILPLASEDFVVVILRQATIFGYSPRMRFDLAINGMTYGAWKNRNLPLMRDGKQWRPMLHVKDAVAAQIFMIECPDTKIINGEIYNVGSDNNCYQLEPLAKLIAEALPFDVEIEWYGDPDHRSYRVGFDKIEALGWSAKLTAEEACLELYEKLEKGEIEKSDRTITLQWYKNLVKWHSIIKDVELHGGILDID